MLLPLRFNRAASRTEAVLAIAVSRLERDEAGAGQDAASAAAEVLGAAVPRGNMGQCDGAVKAGVLPDAEAYT